MDSKPLTYLSKICLIKHMDVDLRLSMAGASAEIHIIEKRVPLTVETMKINLSGYQMNNSEFRVAVLAQSTKGEMSTRVKEQNRLRGFPYPIDKFGFRDYFAKEDPHWKTDVVLRAEPMELETIEQKKKYYKERYGHMAQRFAELSRMEPDSLVADYMALLKIKMSVMEAEHKEMSSGAEYIGLPRAMEIEQGVVKELKEPAKNVEFQFHKAVRALFEYHLGGRTEVIKVKSLHLPRDSGIYPIPSKVKFLVEGLVLSDHRGHLVLDAWEKFIDPRSFPLKTVQVRDCHAYNSDWIATHPIMQNAQIVYLFFGNQVSELLLEFLPKMSNKMIVFNKPVLNYAKLIILMESWLDNKRPIGHAFIMPSPSRAFGNMVLNSMKQHFHAMCGDLYGYSSAFFPINDDAELVVLHRETPTCRFPYLLSIEICPAGFVMEQSRITEQAMEQELLAQNSMRNQNN